MPEALYRFRSTCNLLDGYNELENQEIFFAHPEELNDPMEGFKDLYWTGDSVVWENLLKHYVLCLEHCCSLFIIAGKDSRIEKKDIQVFKTIDDLPTQEYANHFKKICDTIFAHESISQLVANLPTRSSPIRRNELTCHLKRIHNFVVETIFEAHGVEQNRSSSPTILEAQSQILSNLDFIDLLNKAEEEDPEIERLADTICATELKFHSQIDLLSRYNFEMDSNKNNILFIFSEFTEAYIQELEKIIYPEWYAACFMAECKDSSLWGHYGDNHKGVCLIFNKAISLNVRTGMNNSGPKYGVREQKFHKIDYDRRCVEIDFFKSLGRLTHPVISKYWYRTEQGIESALADEVFADEDRWMKIYWDNFIVGITTKLNDWKYEQEYRLILSSSHDYSNKADRKLKYNFNDLNGIIFGINTSREDKLKIIKIIESKCLKEKRKDFKFYQSFHSFHKGIIDYSEMSLLKFKDL